jgi:hypothetical protein
MELLLILWIAFGIVATAYLIYGCILMYHWFSFGYDNATALIASFAYIGVGSFALALFATALI